MFFWEVNRQQFNSQFSFLTQANISFTLFTNGRWPNAQAVIDLLKTMPLCEGLLISLHGPDPATHEAFTQTPSSFKETRENIRRVTEARLRVHT